MSNRIKIEFEKGEALARMEDEGVKILITFSEVEKESVKKAVVDILTNAYEKRVIA